MEHIFYADKRIYCFNSLIKIQEAAIINLITMISTLFIQIVKLFPIPINNSVESIVHTDFPVSSPVLHCYTRRSKHLQPKVKGHFSNYGML